MTANTNDTDIATTTDAAEATAGIVERMRLAALNDLHLLDTPPEERFDRITRIAREVFDVPVAEINLLDDYRQFTKSPQPVGVEVNSGLDDSFCQVTIQGPDLLVVADATQDSRFAHRGTVTGPRHIRFYAGRPLSLGANLRVGTLCLVDTKPREMDATQQQLLDEMGLWVERELRDTVDTDSVQDAALDASGSPIAPVEVAPVLDDEAWPTFEVAGASLPLRKVGSDFFSWTETDGGIDLLIADVMGKGVAAEALAKTIRETFDEENTNDIAEVMHNVNGRLAEGLRASGTFATLLRARVDLETGQVDYADAGHGLTLIVRDGLGVERLDSTGFPLGLMMNGRWEVRSTLLQPGDVLVSFTDGLLNLFDGTLDSLDKVVELVRSASGSQDLIDRVVTLGRRRNAKDDLTIIAITCSE